MSIEEMQENLDLILDTLQEHKPRRKKDAKKPKVRNIKIVDELPIVFSIGRKSSHFVQ